MKKQTVYMVFWSLGDTYDGFQTEYENKVYSTKEQAEEAKKKVEDGYVRYDFPLDWCDEYNYHTDEIWLKMKEEEKELVTIWFDNEYKVDDFNRAWIEELELV